MSEPLTYYEERLPDLIKSLKSQVNKNFEVISKEVESDLNSDRYVNVLKGKRLAAEYSLSRMREIDKLEQDLKSGQEGYYKKKLPTLIENLKKMFDINLKVVDLDIDDEYDDDKLTEDKYVNVLKARDTARVDNTWVLKLIDDLERELRGEDKAEKKQSWARIAADRK
jgi:hypothetical protein